MVGLPVSSFVCLTLDLVMFCHTMSLLHILPKRQRPDRSCEPFEKGIPQTFSFVLVLFLLWSLFLPLHQKHQTSRVSRHTSQEHLSVYGVFFFWRDQIRRQFDESLGAYCLEAISHQRAHWTHWLHFCGELFPPSFQIVLADSSYFLFLLCANLAGAED